MARAGQTVPTHNRIWRLCKKELKETLRDRRTIMTLLLMPLLVYPLLSMALNRFLLSSAAGAAEEGYTIGVQSVAEAEWLDRWLSDPRSLPPEAVLQASGGELAEFKLFVTDEVTPVDALERNQIDVAAKIDLPETDAARDADNGGSPEANGARRQSDEPLREPVRVTLTAYRGDGASQSARRILVERLQWLQLSEAREFVSLLAPEAVSAVRIEVANTGEVEQESMLGTIVPLVLVLMTITGAVYPAIDLTAGERERGTMESLMASPVPRWYVLFAKYIAVVTVALLTAVANLLAMFTTLWAARLLPRLTGSEAFPWLAVLQILVLLVLFSGFFSALLLSLTSFAKSFKEAQAYLIPVMLLSLAPAMLSLMPGVTLSGLMAIAPLINIVLLARDVLSGSVQPAGAVTAVICTIAYAAAALGVAAKLFGSDAVTRTSEQSIGSLFHRPTGTTDVPQVQSAALMLALLVPTYFVVSNALIRFLESFRDTLSASHQLLLNAAALIASFGLVPLIATFLGRNRYRPTYRLHRPPALSLVGALLMGLGAWVFAHEAFVVADALGIGGLDEERIQQTLKVLAAWKQVPPWLLIGTLALTPAVIEELCFRGYLFSAFSKVMTPARTILLTSLLFGLFHVLTGNALLVERFVPSTLLGIMLGCVAYRSGSVLPGMLMHLTHNALLELVGRYHDQFEFIGRDLDDQTHLPAAWIVTGGAITLVGVALVLLATRRRS